MPVRCINACQMRDDESNEVGASSMENIDYEASHFVRCLQELDGDVSFIWNWINQKDKNNCKHVVAVERLRGRRITSMQGEGLKTGNYASLCP